MGYLGDTDPYWVQFDMDTSVTADGVRYQADWWQAAPNA
ncbi:MAG: hypothetical protein ACJAYU_003925 [Bradymonadia bacterium]|jgi:hypothetical protein